MTAQVVTITESNNAQSGLQKIKWVWTTDSANGAIVASSTAGEANSTTGYYTGYVVRFVTDPTTDAPTDDYDVTIIDDDGVDVLLGYGANRDTSTTEQVAEGSLGWIYNSKLSLVIANAGNSKSGIVYLYVAKV